MVYKALLTTDIHPSAEWIYDEVKKELPGISIGTVYRVLDTLTAAGLAKKVDTTNGQARYDAKNTPHHHIYIKNTDQIKDFENEELNHLLEQFFREKKIKNFKITEIKLQVNGEVIDPAQSVHLD